MKGRLARCALAVMLALVCSERLGAGGNINDGPEVGLDDLAARIGKENLPTGAGVIVGQVEVPDAQGDYGPNQGHNEYTGKTFVEMSGDTATSGHANTVAKNYYGNITSIAPGITDIYLWNFDPWLNAGFLRTQTGSLPAASPAGLKLFNCSWIASATFAYDNNALRRADFVMVRDDLLMTVGVDNGDFNVALMSHVYNGISVGVDDGTHMSDPTLAGIDGPGRMQPLIVAPGSLTSWAVPVVGAAAALMIETARTSVSLGPDNAAERSEVIKAVLLAGANHRAGWTNNPATSGPDRGVTSQPLDEVFGADLVNVNTSHLILTGGQQPGSARVPEGGNAQYAGWDLTTVGLGESRYWWVNVCGLADEVSVLATWHRQVDSPFLSNDWAVADFDLFLWRVDEQGDLVTLVGDAGLPFFGDGNVVSESAVDNVEHLYVVDLEPGTYVIELRRLDNETDYRDWEAAVAWNVSAPPPVAGDVNGDCTVNVSDLLIVLGNYGSCPQPCPPTCPGDTNGDCEVDVVDVLAVLANFDTG